MARTKTETPEALPEGMEPKNATEAAVWRALPSADTAIVDCPSVTTMASTVGLSESQAGKMLKRLVDAGHAVAGKHGRSLRYSRTTTTSATPEAIPAAPAPAAEAPAGTPTPPEVLDTAIAGLSPFSGQAEAQAYAALHAGGLDALYRFAGDTTVTSAMLNGWAERKLVRIKHVHGGMQVHSYAKYAKASVPTESFTDRPMTVERAAKLFGVPAEVLAAAPDVTGGPAIGTATVTEDAQGLHVEVQRTESDAESPAEGAVVQGAAEAGSPVSEALAALEGDVQTAPAVPVPVGLATPTADPLTEAEAREITDNIRGKLTELVPLVLRAHRGRAWAALGYANWAAYCEAELYGVKVPLMQRQQAVRVLTDADMSTRAVAGALGVSEGTVRRDLAETGGPAASGVVAGLDGKTYDRSKQGKAATRKDQGPVDVKSFEGDPIPGTATESGTCINCHWAIVRRLDKPGSPWKHVTDGERRCKDADGQFAEPVVQDVTPAAPTVGEALAALEQTVAEHEGTAPAAPATGGSDVQAAIAQMDADTSQMLDTASLAAPPAPLPGLDTDAVAGAIATFAWADYDMTVRDGVIHPLPAAGDTPAEFPEWVRDLAEHIANALGR